jgi:hypothetical protein
MFANILIISAGMEFTIKVNDVNRVIRSKNAAMAW